MMMTTVFVGNPKPGLIFEAAEKYLIDLENSFMIGDGWKDIVAGKTAGCKKLFL
jgi:mannose-1-phosphate guanylyltransferase/phosphomannomutase